jgi:hypothetical protein
VHIVYGSVSQRTLPTRHLPIPFLHNEIYGLRKRDEGAPAQEAREMRAEKKNTPEISLGAACISCSIDRPTPLSVVGAPHRLPLSPL